MITYYVLFIYNGETYGFWTEAPSDTSGPHLVKMFVSQAVYYLKQMYGITVNKGRPLTILDWRKEE